MSDSDASFAYFLDKARNYCDYQERTLQEVKNKLQSWSISDELCNKIIRQLEEEDMINEERYARSYALGKLRNNQWGRNKIIAGMRSKGLPELMIEIGLSEIEEEEYRKILQKVLESKKIKETDDYKRRTKLAQYAYQKGFQPQLIWQLINELDL
ncbi:MAG: regulatory protein [Bacteroidales bacterium]|jgi:regulatory protein|nr:regulatory protein [Bacteroidales bacterium]